jgi:hypothetical protein
VPFVAKALCLPNVDIHPKIPSYKEIDRYLIVDRGIWLLSKRRGAGCFQSAFNRSRRRSERYFSIPLPKTSRQRKADECVPERVVPTLRQKRTQEFREFRKLSLYEISE